MMITIIVIKRSCTFYRREGLFVTIMVTIKRPHNILRLIDSLLGVKYIETDIHIHTTCLNVHQVVTIKHLTRICVHWNVPPSYRRYFE